MKSRDQLPECFLTICTPYIHDDLRMLIRRKSSQSYSSLSVHRYALLGRNLSKTAVVERSRSGQQTLQGRCDWLSLCCSRALAPKLAQLLLAVVRARRMLIARAMRSTSAPALTASVNDAKSAMQESTPSAEHALLTANSSGKRVRHTPSAATQNPACSAPRPGAAAPAISAWRLSRPLTATAPLTLCGPRTASTRHLIRVRRAARTSTATAS